MIASITPLSGNAVSIDWMTLNIWLEDDHVKVDFEIVFEIQNSSKGFILILNEPVENLRADLINESSLSEKHFLNEMFGKYFFGPSWSITDRTRGIVRVKGENLCVVLPKIEVRSVDKNAVLTLTFKDLAGNEVVLERGRYGLAFYLIFNPLEEVLDETRRLFATRIYDRQLVSNGVFEKLDTGNTINIKNVHVYLVLPEHVDIIRTSDHTRYGHLEKGLNPWNQPPRLDIYWLFRNVRFPSRNFRILAEYEQKYPENIVLEKKKKQKIFMIEIMTGFLLSLTASALVAYFQTSLSLGIISFAGLMALFIFIWIRRYWL